MFEGCRPAASTLAYSQEMKSASILATIDERLRRTLFGLRCVLDVNLSGAEIERIFSDAQEDPVSAKDYTLFSGRSVEVQIHVDEYEPESAHIEVQSKTVSQERLESIHEDAGYDMIREQRGIDQETTSRG